jgi:hypothetical protein
VGLAVLLRIIASRPPPRPHRRPLFLSPSLELPYRPQPLLGALIHSFIVIRVRGLSHSNGLPCPIKKSLISPLLETTGPLLEPSSILFHLELKITYISSCPSGARHSITALVWRNLRLYQSTLGFRFRISLKLHPRDLPDPTSENCNLRQSTLLERAFASSAKLEGGIHSLFLQHCTFSSCGPATCLERASMTLQL